MDNILGRCRECGLTMPLEEFPTVPSIAGAVAELEKCPGCYENSDRMNMVQSFKGDWTTHPANPEVYPDDVPHPKALCICGHPVGCHSPRECKHCSCTYPRTIHRDR